jgi:NADH dehydrogenase
MFIYISSLAAERGQSAYHASKREAEALVRGYAGDWVILRPGNVFGPGDDVISQLLSMHRTLPAVPVIGAGDHRFQPVWYLDLGAAIAAAIEQHTSGGVYELSGGEVTTPNEILSHFEAITGRKPLRIPVPEFLATVTARVTEAAGLPFPINEGQFQMLIEENVLRNPEHNALTRVFGVAPTPLRKALAILADAQPEQRPGEGVGGMERKKFWADITGSPLSPEELMDQFRSRVTEVMPIDFDAEPGTPQQVVEGATLTAALPMRGNIQIRVAENEPRTVTFATLRGHPLAGVVRFSADHHDAGALRFTVSVFARAATMVDWLAMSTVGGVAQNSTWRTVVERMVDISGGTAESIDEEKGVCDETECAQVEAWIDAILTRQHRAEHERPVGEKQGA